MSKEQTIGERMEEMRIRAGAREYAGHEYMDLNRFDENTKHMVIFKIISNEASMGFKGEKMRLFLTETGYQKALDNQEKGYIKILSHAKVRNGKLSYDRHDQLR